MLGALHAKIIIELYDEANLHNAMQALSFFEPHIGGNLIL